MNISKPSQDFAIAIAILIAFCAPLYLLLISILTTDSFKSQGALLAWAVYFLGNQDSALAQFHKILLPLVTGISAWQHKDANPTLSSALVIFCVANVLLAIVVDIYFKDPLLRNAIQGNYADYSPNSATTYFTRVQETLMMYLMVLMGLKASKQLR